MTSTQIPVPSDCTNNQFFSPYDICRNHQVTERHRPAQNRRSLLYSNVQRCAVEFNYSVVAMGPGNGHPAIPLRSSTAVLANVPEHLENSTTSPSLAFCLMTVDTESFAHACNCKPDHNTAYTPKGNFMGRKRGERRLSQLLPDLPAGHTSPGDSTGRRGKRGASLSDFPTFLPLTHPGRIVHDGERRII